jgi:hypothetical protein
MIIYTGRGKSTKGGRDGDDPEGERPDGVWAEPLLASGPRSGPLCDRCLDREARNRRAALEVFVRYVVWPELYVEDREAGA